MNGLILGAGFSKWAADLPLARQLFDFRISPFGVREEGRLQLVVRLKSAWDAEHQNEPTEKFIADALSFPHEHKQAVLWYIVRRLSDPFVWAESNRRRCRRHVLMIDENRKLKIEGVKRAQSFLQRFGILTTGVITTNYDLLIEYALGTKGFNYGVYGQSLIGRGAYPVSQWNNPITLKGNLPLAKIHGSISWDDTNFYTDGRRGLTGNALIVAPTPEKSPPAELEPQWGLSARILHKTTHLVVFGFAFNSYDEAVLNHLRNNGKKIMSVMLIDISPNLYAAKLLWPDACVTSAFPPPDGDAEINRWLQVAYAESPKVA